MELLGLVQMTELEAYFDRLDAERVSRARELTAIKRSFGSSSDPSLASVRSKATVVLCYAVWEGYYNDCVVSTSRFSRRKGEGYDEPIGCCF